MPYKPVKPLTPVDKVFKRIIQTQLLPYQIKWLADKSKFKIGLKARQIGWSTICSLEALYNVLYKNENQYFVSASQRQSIELLAKFYTWLDVFEACGIKLNITSRSKTEVTINGCSVYSLTSNVNTSQGFTGSVFLDEASLLPNDKELYNGILPSITLNGSIKIIARPAGQNNLFYEIWSDEKKYKKYSRHKCDIHEAIAQGLKVDISDIRESMDDESFSENYECQFIDSSSSFFPYDLLRTCYGTPQPDVEGATYITIDVGRSNDRTAICVFVKDSNEVYNLVEWKELHKMEFTKQEETIGEYIKNYSPLKVVIDKGFNPQLCENLEKKFKGLVVGAHCNDEFKHKGFSFLKKLFEDKKILIEAHEDIIRQLHSVKRENTVGKVKYTAPRNASGHADLAFSMMMLYEAVGDKKTIFSARLVKGN